MSASEAQIRKAVENLTRARYTQRRTIEEIGEALAERAPFCDLDDPELMAVARIVQARLPAGAAPATRATATAAPASAGPARTFPVTPSAPFRFVALPDIVAPAEPGTRHDKPIPGGFCARIRIEWAAEGPLLIGEARNAVIEPLRRPGQTDGYVIPGATQRGLVRAGLEIVAHGRIGVNANLHHRYGLRDFDHPAYADRSPVSRVDEVQAGWLRWEGGTEKTWTIEPLGRNWSHVLIEQLLASRLAQFSTRTRERWIQSELLGKYRELGIVRPGEALDFAKTFGFTNAALDGERRMATPGGGRPGVLVFSNKLPGSGGKKKFEYVFFDEPVGKRVALSDAVVETFERLHSKTSKNRPEAVGSWALLRKTLAADGRLPVFYVGDLHSQDRRFAFGLTRLFKVPHENSVGEVLAAQPAQMPRPTRDPVGAVTGYEADFVENLFGYVVEADALGLPAETVIAPDAVGRKGRVAFSFARLLNPQDAQVSKPVTTVMMAPRASYAPFYLKSTAEPDYSAEPKPLVAGRKRYLPRSAPGEATAALKSIVEMGERQIARIERQNHKPVSEDVKSRLSFLMPRDGAELRFAAEIRLHNVTAAELGGILFVLTHGGEPSKPFRHMMGRAKAFGAGQMRLARLHLAVVPNDGDSALVVPPAAAEVADAAGRTGFTPAPTERAADNASLRPFLQAFVTRMAQVPGLKAFPQVQAVQEFLGASDPEATRALAGLDYMDLPEFNAVRDATKPLRPRPGGRAPQGPARSGTADGRLLPAPATKRTFWT